MPDVQFNPSRVASLAADLPIISDRVGTITADTGYSPSHIFDANKGLALVASGPNDLQSSVSTMDRLLAGITAGPTMTNQLLRVAYFTPNRSFITTQGRMATTATAAGATPTLCRMAIYNVNSSGDLTSILATHASDTAMFAAASTAYTKTWTTAAQLNAGTRYAFAALVVTGAAAPTVMGIVDLGPASEYAIQPMLNAELAAQADLPASQVFSGLTASKNTIYAAAL